jgi:predicted ATP-grasp superfamily ATP-dependent carboligase
MNLFYTGLGIARSLGEKGIPVIGLTAQRGVYGNLSRYVTTAHTADSRNDPETLLSQMIALGERLGQRAVLFPTRDHDLVFIDRFRAALDPYYVPVVPSSEALRRCLDKWETYLAAKSAAVPVPKCVVIETADALSHATQDIEFPCVLKPVAAHQWRSANNWSLVGGRKAISVNSIEELMSAYAGIAAAGAPILVQEEVPGPDDSLFVVACYVDRQGRFQGAFNLQKLVQIPAGFGTGCIVQTADRPELVDRTERLLRTVGFTGIAEVEYKWDARCDDYKLIEINPRPWDQHRLGVASGVDVMYLAYCDCAGLGTPELRPTGRPMKWIAEDAFLLGLLGLLWRREGGLLTLLRQAGGPKMFAIWSVRDPLPFIAYVTQLIPQLGRMVLARASPHRRSPRPEKAGAAV